jgi:hypothetical protein
MHQKQSGLNKFITSTEFYFYFFKVDFVHKYIETDTKCDGSDSSNLLLVEGCYQY